MKLVVGAKMYNELKRLGYNMDQFLKNEPIKSTIYNQLYEDLKVLKLRYPRVPISKIKSLKEEYGAIMADAILQDDKDLYNDEENNEKEEKKCDFCTEPCNNDHCPAKGGF